MQPTTLTGRTTRFRGNGRKLGYPTANLDVATDLKDGVYFGLADLGDYAGRPALVFIGTPTTVGDTGRRVEAHLLDVADRDYYDLELRLDIRHYHRPNQTFASVGELTTAMAADEAAGRAWFHRAALATDAGLADT